MGAPVGGAVVEGIVQASVGAGVGTHVFQSTVVSHPVRVVVLVGVGVSGFSVVFAS